MKSYDAGVSKYFRTGVDARGVVVFDTGCSTFFALVLLVNTSKVLFFVGFLFQNSITVRIQRHATRGKLLLVYYTLVG